MWPFKKLCIHDWAFAEGTSPGIITGQPRTLCLRRACVKCHKREHVMCYSYCYQNNGMDYMAGPQWVADESPWGT